MDKKDQAKKEKAVDKQQAMDSLKEDHVGPKTLVVTVDMQAVLLSPSLQASALYYKQKLCVHNYTVYNLATHGVTCYVWHEGEGGLTSSEFSTCLCDYLEDNPGYAEVIIYSDGCGYQNRNVTLSNALINYAEKHNVIITQKILERGHTQMEVDSVHSKIEQKLKPGKKRCVSIYCPADYVNIIENARSLPEPYKVKYVNHEFFKDYSKTTIMKSIRPGKKVGDPTVNNLRAMRYTPDNLMHYKLKLSDNWRELNMTRRPERAQVPVVPVAPTVLHRQSLPIAASKYKHLQELKSVLPADYHLFYDNLRHI
jgi:hypothetical protein